MNRVSINNAIQFQKVMIKGGLAAAAPGLIALTAAFCAPVSILGQYTGMGQIGVAAMGILFFGAAWLFSTGHWWAGMPALGFAGWALWVTAGKAARLLLLYYSHNPVQTLNDIFAPFAFISLQLTLVFIAGTISVILLKAFSASRTLAPRPVNRYIWGAAGLWTAVVVLDCMGKFQY